MAACQTLLVCCTVYMTFASCNYKPVCCALTLIIVNWILQPNILDEYVKERGLAVAAASGKLTGPEDLLILEDEKARMVLRGVDLPIASLVTGELCPFSNILGDSDST